MKVCLMIEAQEGVRGTASCVRRRGVQRVMLQHLQHEHVERVAVLGEAAARLR
jgi:hypothetical protein